MFGRGNWAIIGLAKNSLRSLQNKLVGPHRHGGCVAVGGIRRHPAI